jgi:hypothetical protein
MPGKIAHLVPMQRFDSSALKRTLSVGKPSNTDYHLQSPTNLQPNPLTTTTSLLAPKPSLDDHPTSSRSQSPPPPFSSSHPSTSINSLKNPDNAITPTRLQTVLSRFRQDVELIPIRFDANVKRSSV